MSHATRRVLRGAMVVFSWFVSPYSRIKNLWIPNRKLPPIKNPILQIRAVELAHMIRTKQVTCEVVIQAYVDRCKEVNPILNAIVEERFDEALKEAKMVDEMIAQGEKTVEQLKTEMPLLGLPITVKESISVQGMINQSGRVYKKKNVALNDAPCVEQVKKHGGIVLLVSNTPELCMCWETYNNVSGQTKNPYDVKRTPGGSSGGEAALLGSGASLIGLSSDIAGSSRLPAMFTGVYGHKPSPYAVSYQGHIPNCDIPNFGDFFTIAPMTRYASDLPLLLNSMIDPIGAKLSLDQDINVGKINFFYMENDGPSGSTTPISQDIQVALSDVATHFRAKKVHIDNLKWSLEVSMSTLLRIDNVETIYYKAIDGEPLKKKSTELLKYCFGLSDSIFPSVAVGHLQETMKIFPEVRHKKMTKIANKLKKEFQDLLGTNGVFLYPTFPSTAHHHYKIYQKLTDTSYMMIFNTIGLPVTNCMIRLDRHKLPIGIQVVTNVGQDHLSLAVARAIESHYGGWIPPS